MTAVDELATVLGGDGAIRAANASFQRTVGPVAPEPDRRSVFEVLHPDDWDGVRGALEQLAATGGAVGPLRFRLACQDGLWFDGSATFTLVTGDTGVDGAVVVTVHATPPARPPGTDQPGHAEDGPMASALGDALGARQLRLVYQPKVALAGNRLVGVEALLRWEHPTFGMVPPDRFIPIAEATGLIVPIGAWVLEEACRQGASWQHLFPRMPPFAVAVNASAGQFDAELVDVVRGTVRDSGIEPTGLGLEVTESTVMDDVDGAIAILGELKSLGIAVSIDDFGTGYSSLQYLRRLPLDEVKIDRSFVRGLPGDPQDTAIVAAVISLAHALNHDVVAEGVETFEQLDKLRGFGCEMAQGYLIARPMPGPAVTELLRREAAGEHLAGGGPGLSAFQSTTDTVVVADDASDVRQLVRMSLTAAGFEVEEAVDASGAVALARRVNATCVVLDVNMPDMSGIDVCRLLRADPSTAGVTVVMLTSRHEAADKVAAFSAGADDYIVKPFAPRDLVSRVRAALGRRSGGGFPSGSAG